MKESLLVILTLLQFLAPVAAQVKKQKTAAPTQQHAFHRCGTQQVMNELLRKYPQLQAERNQLRQKAWQQYTQLLQQRSLQPATTYTIPVVVHVVLPDPSVVTDAQIQAQLDVLNQDYAGLNADSTRIPAAFKPLFGKGNLRFCLARTDTRGDGTNGIQRVTSLVQSSPGLADPVKFTCSGGSDAWDASRYLNIWVCNMPGGFLGYSFFGSDPLSVVPLNERGFVNNFRFFGKGGSAQAPFNLGRTATHEIGHFFDLDHIWGPNNCDGAQGCGDDDGIGDTPLQVRCNFGAPAADSIITDICSPAAPGIMWMNYMDYVDDRAMVMYTPGQYARMNATILANSWLLQLASSNACMAPGRNLDVRFEQFRDPGFEVCGQAGNLLYTCDNSYRPLVTIRNTGTDTVRTLSIGARFGSATPVVTNWTGVLPPFGTTNILLNNMPLVPGLNAQLTVFTSAPNNGTDQKPSNDTGRIAGVVFATGSLPFSEGFESLQFPPGNWRNYNGDASIGWERTTRAAASGTASVFINNFDYSANNVSDFLFSPQLPLAGADSAFLTFSVAAATFNQPDLTNNPTDTLEILITSDCGATYRSVYRKWGRNLVTTGNIGVDSGYVPRPDQWRRDSVYLGDFSAASSQAQIVFRNITNFENNIYIDNINVFTKEVNPNLKRKGVMATPNPFRDQLVVQHFPNPQNIEYMQLISSAGQVVWQQRIALGQSGTIFGPNLLVVNTANLASGVYTLQIVYRNRRNETIRLVKL